MSTVFPAAVDTYSTKVDRGIVYHNYINDLQDAVVALETYARAEKLFNVKSAEFGAVGDGVTNDTSAINAAIAAANAINTGGSYGATVYFPPGKYQVSTTLTTPYRNVTLLGSNGASDNTYKGASQIQITSTSVPMFDLGNAATSGVTFRDLTLRGSGGTTLANHCIYATSASGCYFTNLMIDNFGGSAIRIDGGNDNVFHRILATNCLLGYASLSDFAGVLEFGCIEVFGYECNINGVAGLIGTHNNHGSGYMCAMYVKQSEVHWYSTTFAFAQTGVRVANISTLHEFQNCRFEAHQGRGLWFGGIFSRISHCRFQDNSQATNNTYPHCQIGTSGGLAGTGNQFIGNRFDNPLGLSYVPTYGFDIQAGNSAAWSYRNLFAENAGDGYTTKLYSIDASNVSPVLIAPLARQQTLTGTGTQTFDGQQGDYWKLVVNANTTTTVAATNLLLGHTYNIEILNSSGATPAINLDTVFKSVGYTAPADTKRKSFACRYDGTNLILIGAVSADF